MVRATLILGLICLSAAAQAPPRKPERSYPILKRAYAALRARDYAAAVREFHQAIQAAPGRVSIRKDLAYTLLKIGENEAARDQFAEVIKLSPSDFHTALEYAFLCNETGMQATARRLFDRIRKTGDPVSRATAERAFENIDRPLADGIRRWRAVVEAEPGNFSAHRELARLAERRNELRLAADQYEQAWRLRPKKRALLLDLGRLWKQLGRPAVARAALLAASRGTEPRTAERARALLPRRYPYVYEFQQALRLDPTNTPLRREYGYLLLQMGRKKEAESQFRIIVKRAPHDMLSRAQLGFLLLNQKDMADARPLLQSVLASGDRELANRVRSALGLPPKQEPAAEKPRKKVSTEARVLAERSLKAGYLKDAVKYLKLVHEADPTDFTVMLKLGQTQNILKNDEQAIRWFDLARRSPDLKIAAKAERAYKNLRPAFARFRTTFWMMPFYSSRWNSLFGYAQLKTEIRLGRLPFRPYVSLRFAGDARRTIGQVAPRYLSESSFIFGLGVRTISWKGLAAWMEAGSDISYLDRTDRAGRMAPDYRGGVSFAKGFGNLLGGEAAGPFLETFDDGVFMSRFHNTFLGYSHNRFGYTPAVAARLGELETQLYWNVNLTCDTKRQPWANFAETGPGFRFRWKAMPKSLVFSVDLLRGFYLMDGYPGGRSYYDLRVGAWYAITK